MDKYLNELSTKTLINIIKKLNDKVNTSDFNSRIR